MEFKGNQRTKIVPELASVIEKEQKRIQIIEDKNFMGLLKPCREKEIDYSKYIFYSDPEIDKILYENKKFFDSGGREYYLALLSSKSNEILFINNQGRINNRNSLKYLNYIDVEFYNGVIIYGFEDRIITEDGQEVLLKYGELKGFKFLESQDVVTIEKNWEYLCRYITPFYYRNWRPEAKIRYSSSSRSPLPESECISKDKVNGGKKGFLLLGSSSSMPGNFFGVISYNGDYIITEFGPFKPLIEFEKYLLQSQESDSDWVIVQVIDIDAIFSDRYIILTQDKFKKKIKDKKSVTPKKRWFNTTNVIEPVSIECMDKNDQISKTEKVEIKSM